MVNFNRKTNIVPFLRKFVIFQSVLFFLVTSIYFLIIAFTTYKREVATLRKNYYTMIKQQIKSNVQKAVVLINFAEKSSPGIANNKIKSAILDTIGKFRFGKNNEGYIFIVTYDGITVLNDIQKELVGKNLWDMTDPNGVKVIQEERKAAEKKEGGFIYYTWNKPATGKRAPKLSFILGIPTLQWMVGAGLYVDDIEKEVAILRDRRLDSFFTSVVILLIIFTSLILILFLIQRKVLHMIENDNAVLVAYFSEGHLKTNILDNFPLHFEEFSDIAHVLKTMNKVKTMAVAKALYNKTKFDDLFSNISDVIIVMNTNKTIVHANQPALLMDFGYEIGEIVGKSALLLFKNYSEYERVVTIIDQIASGEKTSTITNLVYKRKDGSTFHAEALAYSIISENPDEMLIATINRDISRRVEAQKKLEESLSQKEFLLREVQHRVRNNLSVILGLVSLQKAIVSGEQVTKALASVEGKVHAMALAYNFFYEEDGTDKIPAGNYIKALIHNFIENHPEINAPKTIMDDIPMEIDQIIPLGLITSEFMLNIERYNFNPRHENPWHLISLKKSGKNTVILDIELEREYSVDVETYTNGISGEMTIIEALVSQINGKLQVTTDKEIHYTLFFDIGEY